MVEPDPEHAAFHANLMGWLNTVATPPAVRRVNAARGGEPAALEVFGRCKEFLAGISDRDNYHPWGLAVAGTAI